jgi:Ribonuclease G/E
MDRIVEEKQKALKSIIETTEQFIGELDPTTLIDIEFYKSHGLWDEEVSKKFDEVMKKWEHIQEMTEKEKTPSSIHHPKK